MKFPIERSEQEQSAMEDNGLETEFGIVGENETDTKVLYYQRFVQTTLRRVCSFNPIGS